MRTLSNGQTLAFVAGVYVDALAATSVVAYAVIDGKQQPYAIQAANNGRWTNIDKPRAGAPKNVIGELYTNLGARLGLLPSDIAEIEQILAPERAKIAAYQKANAARVRAEAAYDSLQNEGYSDGYNPYRTARDDGDATPLQKGDEAPA